MPNPVRTEPSAAPFGRPLQPFKPIHSGSGHSLYVVFGIAVALALLWLTLRIDLLIFAGVLLAIFLRGCARLLSERIGIGVGPCFTLVVAAVILLLAGLIWVFFGRVNAQMTELSQRLPAALDRWRHLIGDLPWLDQFLHKTTAPSTGTTIASVLGLAATTISMVGALVIVLVTGVYGGAEADLYWRGLLHLIPVAKRERLASVLVEADEVLWYWILGRLFSMAVIGASIGIGMWLLGLPAPISLGLLAGLLTFVPYVGTFASALPPILLAAMIRPSLVLYVVLLFTAIHMLESYLLIPLVQRRATHLPPALLLSAQAVAFAVAGILGVALATPLAAAAVVLVRRLYVEDVVGDLESGMADHAGPAIRSTLRP